MAYLIQARVSLCSIMYVPCSFAQGSDHSQGLRLVWPLPKKRGPAYLHHKLPQVHHSSHSKTASTNPEMESPSSTRWFSWCNLWSRPCKAKDSTTFRIRKNNGSKMIKDVQSAIQKILHYTFSPTVSVLKGNRFHLRGQFSKNGLQPDCRWRTQSSNCMDLDDLFHP